MNSNPIKLNKSIKKIGLSKNHLPKSMQININFIQNQNNLPKKSINHPYSSITSSIVHNSNFDHKSKNYSKNTSKKSSFSIQRVKAPKPESNQSSIAQILNDNKQKIIMKNIEEKNRNKELDRLLKERDALRNALCNIIDFKTTQIISQKMISLTKKINKFLRLNEGTVESTEKEENISVMNEEDSFWKKRNDSLKDTIEDFDKDILVILNDNELNDNLVKKTNDINKAVIDDYQCTIKECFEKNSKIEKIFKDIELIEQNKKIDKRKKLDVLKEVPNFCFLREPNEQIYTRSAKCDNTLSMKSYRPKGFRSEKISVNIPIKINSVSRRNKRFSIHRSRISKSTSTIKVKDNFYLTRGSSPVNHNKIRSINSASSLRNSFGSTLQNPNLRTNIIKRFRQLIMELMNENNKNRDYINKVFREKMNKDKEFKKNMENEIDLLEREYYQRKDKKSIKLKDSDEEEEDIDNKKLLKKIDKRARGYFQKYFNDVDFKKRLLNKEGDEEMTFYEKKISQMKMQKEFKYIAYQTLHLEGVKKNEDIQYMKKELIKDVFSVDNIEWQVKKHSVLRKLRNKNR